MTEKETLIGARAKTATAMAGFGGVCFRDDQHRHALPGCLVFDELRQLVVGHTGYDTVHPLASGSLPDTLQVSQHDSRACLFCLLHYLAGNLVADGIYLAFLGIPHFLNSAQQQPLPKPLSQPCVVSPNPPDFLTEKLGVDTITATDGGQVSLPKVYSKETVRIDSRLIHLSLNGQVDKPSVLSFNELGLSQRAINGNVTVGLQSQPNTTSHPKTGELKPAWGDIGVPSLQTNNVPAQDKRVVPMLGMLNLLKKSLCLLPGSRIEVCPLAMNDTLEALVFLFQNIPLPASWRYDFGLNCLLNQHLNLTLSLDIFADCLIGYIPRRGNEVAISPEGRDFAKLGKFTPEIAGAASLECLDQLMHGELGIARNKQVQVVWLYFQSQYINPLLLCYLLKYLPQLGFHFIYQYLAPPLRTPDEMIVYQIDLICRMLIFHTVYSILLFYTSVNTEKGDTPHSSPALKCGAF
jgi:hypothetical protein